MTAHELKIVFAVFECLKENQRRIKFYVRWKLYEVQILVSISEVLLHHILCSFICVLSMAANVTTTSELEVATEVTKLKKSKIFILEKKRKTLLTLILAVAMIQVIADDSLHTK